jgi:hypothetical protein
MTMPLLEKKMTLVGPQYRTYDAMVKANYPSWSRHGKR